MNQLSIFDNIEIFDVAARSGNGTRGTMDVHEVTLAYHPDKTGTTLIRFSPKLTESLKNFDSVLLGRNKLTGEVYIVFTIGASTQFRLDRYKRAGKEASYPVINSISFAEKLMDLLKMEKNADSPVKKLEISDNMANEPKHCTFIIRKKSN